MNKMYHVIEIGSSTLRSFLNNTVEINEANLQRKIIYDVFKAGVITDEEYKTKIEELLKNVKAL